MNELSVDEQIQQDAATMTRRQRRAALQAASETPPITRRAMRAAGHSFAVNPQESSESEFSDLAGLPTRRSRRAAGETRGRERARATRSKRRLAQPPKTQVPKQVARATLLAALVAPAVGIPALGLLPADVGANAAPLERTAEPSSVSTLEVLAAPQVAVPNTDLLPVVDVNEAALVASRTDIRTILPGCDGMTRPLGENGQLRISDLCELDWAPGERLRADAAVALAELNVAFQANFGYPLCLTSTYRDLAGQYASRYSYGYMAATPGTSNHGWGLAVDFCYDVVGDSAAMEWLRSNGPTFGWNNPDWARNPNSPYYKPEPWHWEFTSGVIEMGNDW